MNLYDDTLKNDNEKDELLKLYDMMGIFILKKIKSNNVNPVDVAHESGMSSDKMLEILCNSDKGDYLAFREMDNSIKKLSKERHEGKIHINELKR